MDLTAYHKRKEAFIQRVKTMIDYTRYNECRSKFINQYFGDNSNRACGICDSCLRKPSASLSTQEFKEIAATIVQHLSAASLTLPELLVKFEGIHKEKAQKALHFLQAEQKVSFNKEGQILLLE
jgi:ATP-dependent DNA helicase RecQ